MPDTVELTDSDAFDRILSAFAGRGWHDDGDTTRAVVAAALGAKVNVTTLGSAVPRAFLVNNGISRTEALRAITEALRGVDSVIRTGSVAPVTNISVTNLGNFAGNVGGGSVSEVRQAQQLVGDAAVEALVAQFAERAKVKQIRQAQIPDEEKRKRLGQFLRSLGGKALDVSEDVAAKVITGLLTGK